MSYALGVAPHHLDEEARASRMRSVVCWAVFVAVSLLLATGLVPMTRRGSTCVLCRADRLEWACLGVRWSCDARTACSRWYAAHVEPTHTHVWVRSPCYYEVNLWGAEIGSGCYPRPHPIWRLPPETQLAVYQHLANPAEARGLFTGAGDHRVVRAVVAWAAAKFPGTWARWYETHGGEPSGLGLDRP
jgi:hypothetical protein